MASQVNADDGVRVYHIIDYSGFRYMKLGQIDAQVLPRMQH